MIRTKPMLRTIWAAALVVLLGLTSQVGAATPEPATATAAGPVEIVLRVRTPAYRLDADGLHVAGYSANDAPGAPMLPVWSTVVELPATGEWRLTVEAGETRVIHLDRPLPAVPVPQPIPPAPLGWAVETDRPDAVPTADRPDPAIYHTNGFYPAGVAHPGQEQWQRGRRLLALRVFPFEYNPVAGIVRYHPDMRITVRVQEAGVRGQESGDRRQRSGDRSQEAPKPAAASATTPCALRINTGARGMYRLTYDELTGADSAIASADPATFAISYLGQKVDIRRIIQAPGRFSPDDMVVFYAEPYQGRYLDHNVYCFTYGGTGSAEMATRLVKPTGSEPKVTEMTRTLHLERDRLYMSTIARSNDADHWFDGPIGPPYAPISYTLTLSDTVLSGDLVLRVLANSGPAQSTDTRSISLRLNDHDAGTYTWTGLTDYLATATVPASWLDATPNQLGIWPGTGILYPDWIEVTYPAQARAYGNAVHIEDIAAGANEVKVTGFSAPDFPDIPDVVVYDLRDPRHPVLIDAPPLEYDYDTAAYAQHFWDEDLPGPTYCLSTDAALAAPVAIEPVTWLSTPSPLHSPDNRADYIAIVHSALWKAIDPLLEHRRVADGFTVAKVDVQQIYDEFSYGRRDPEAIRTFLSYAYHNWRGPAGDASPPLYVLLVGDGHYDFTGVSGTTLPNLVPPYLVNIDPWIGETAADNRFVSVDGPDDILPDMSIGRIPAQNPDDVTAVVDKILAYETTAQAGDWQHRAFYVADNCADGAGDFHWLSDQARLGWLPAAYDDRIVYYGNASTCPESTANTASGMQSGVRAAFDGGAFMLQWFGHSARARWGTPAEYPPGQLPIYTLSSNVPATFNANTTWPITFAYSCWSGYFMNLSQPWYVNYMDETVGEALLVTPARGSVADVSPSGLHVGGALVVLNQGMTQAIFQDRIDRMGPAVDASKLYYWSGASGFLDVIDTSILFGDPATRLRLPPIVSIARNNALARLSWKPVPQYVRYEVWRSTRPYFSPDDPDLDPPPSCLRRRPASISSPTTMRAPSGT